MKLAPSLDLTPASLVLALPLEVVLRLGVFGPSPIPLPLSKLVKGKCPFLVASAEGWAECH